MVLLLETCSSGGASSVTSAASAIQPVMIGQR